MAKKEEAVTYKSEEGICWITLNRPHRLNAISVDMAEAFLAAIEKAEQDKEVKVVVITGAGERSFSSGADVTVFPTLTAITAEEGSATGQDIFSKIEKSSKPYIAAINGYCLGGGLELSLACDFRIAAEHATFGNPEIKLGLIPGWGGTQRLVRICGLAKAKELVMLGEQVIADEALRLGLVNKVVRSENLMEQTKILAKKLASGPPIALKYAKRLLNLATQVPLDVGLMVESEAFGLLRATKDVVEGISSFMSKSEPEFKGE